MNDYHSTLANALNSILPTYYELALTASIPTPCISYIGINNYASANGNTLGYSKVSYRVKVWGNNIAQLLHYASLIDDKLRPMGLTRISCGELYDRESTMIQVILTYEGLALENFK